MNREITFKDYFTGQSDKYNRYRPSYPPALFDYLASISAQHERAWDCATGTGQVAVSLADYYENVIATDASQSQIDNAVAKEGVTYELATAEYTQIEHNSVDIVTVAQSLHWFDIDKFTVEVNRVLKVGGILGVWTYNLLTIRQDIDAIINHLYSTVLAEYWPQERKMVEDAYSQVIMPFEQIQAPQFEMCEHWSFDRIIGYLYTWSAVKQYQQQTGLDPVKQLADQLLLLWGGYGKKLPVTWPLTVKLWTKNS